MVQWLGLHALTAYGAGSIPGRGTKIPQALRCGQKKKIERYYLDRKSKGRSLTAACENNIYITLGNKCHTHLTDVVEGAWTLGFRPGFESWRIHSTGMN